MSFTRRELLNQGIFLGSLLAPSAVSGRQGQSALSFPKGFIWGAATAAYQIEGAASEDGRGPSVWDIFSHTPGKVKQGHTGDVACDSYHRWREDLALLKTLGLKSYRFSIAWPRIQPTGTGAVNQPGLDYYSRLVDALLELGIRPLPTLYHWDLPQALEEKGGWPNRDTANRMVDYAALVANSLHDRVKDWCVFNEPKTFTQNGYWSGGHAPGRREPVAFLRAVHTVHLAYGRVYRALKSIDSRLQVGNALDLAPMYPASSSLEDRQAAKRWDTLLNQWFLQPALTGAYPAGILPEDRLADLAGIRAGDGAVMKAPFDFLGFNYYTPWRVRHDPTSNGLLGLQLNAEWAKAPRPDASKMDIGWEIYPPGFSDILRRVHAVVGDVPMEITENGAAYNNGPDSSGQVRDPERIAYLRSHLTEVLRAISAGVPIRGYHAWSLLDNFEWAEGYTQRFGIVHVDFATQKRTVKDSGHWLAKVAASNRLP